MNRLQPYLLIVWALVLNLLGLGWRVVRQVVLPGRRGAGNLLSSLFLLFAGLAEQLISCRQSLLRLPWAYAQRLPARDKLAAGWTFSKKYIRLGMLIATWALFILSSLEWAPPEQPGSGTPVDAQQVTTVIRDEQTATDAASVIVSSSPAYVTGSNHTRCFSVPSSPPIAIQRWLLLRTLRI